MRRGILYAAALSILKIKKENIVFASLASKRRAAGGQYKWARGGKTAEKSKKGEREKREKMGKILARPH